MKIISGILVAVIIALIVGCAAPSTIPPGGTTPPPEEVVEDLAYIKASGSEYSDDADPEPEGAEITILWYDTKSEIIFFDDVPVKVTIEIFAAKSEESPHRFTESVYKGEHHIDNNRSNIRIPFVQMMANPEIHWCSGRANVVAHTPQQGNFSVEGILVPLCPKPPLKPPPTPPPLPKP